jgi:hypothetical protein
MDHHVRRPLAASDRKFGKSRRNLFSRHMHCEVWLSPSQYGVWGVLRWGETYRTKVPDGRNTERIWLGR